MSEKLDTLKKYFSYLLIGAVVILALAAVAAILTAGILVLSAPPRPAPPPPPPVAPPPPPSSVVTPPPLFGIPRFASNAAVLELRDELQQFKKEIDTTDFFQIQIQPPSLDSNIQI